MVNMLKVQSFPDMPVYADRSCNEPVATIKMKTRTALAGKTSNKDLLKKRVQLPKYFGTGSNVSLTDSINSALRMTSSPRPAKNGSAFLQALSESQRSEAELWTARSRHFTHGSRLSQSSSTNESSLLPILSSKGIRQSYEFSGVEFDADVTIVDPDVVLDQNSETVLSDCPAEGRPIKDEGGYDDRREGGRGRDEGSGGGRGEGRGDSGRGGNSGRGEGRIHHGTTDSAPPVPPPDALSKRQLKLIGTNADTFTASAYQHVDKALSQIIAADRPLQNRSDITPRELYELAEPVSEKMMVNKAKLLLLQHTSKISIDRDMTVYNTLKRPPPGIPRPSPLNSAITQNSNRSPVTYRATTAPPTRSTVPRSHLRSRLRSTSGLCAWSVPCTTDGKARAKQLLDPLIIRSLHPRPGTPVTTIASTIAPSSTAVTPVNETSDYNLPQDMQTPYLLTTPYVERCAKYRRPREEYACHTPISEVESFAPEFEVATYSPISDAKSLSETPLLQTNFSSLTSFFPSALEV